METVTPTYAWISLTQVSSPYSIASSKPVPFSLSRKDKGNKRRLCSSGYKPITEEEAKDIAYRYSHIVI
jgi:hypothetical protein